MIRRDSDDDFRSGVYGSPSRHVHELHVLEALCRVFRE